MVGVKTIVELNIFENYDVHVIIPQNNESGKLDQKNIGSNYQNNYEIILNKTISDTR